MSLLLLVDSLAHDSELVGDNPSFEIQDTTGGQIRGNADQWLTAFLTQASEFAVFGESVFFTTATLDLRTEDAFEEWWRAPRSREIPGGQSSWGEFSGGAFVSKPAPPGTGYVTQPVIKTTGATLAAGGNVLVTLTYTSEDFVAGRVGTCTIQNGTVAGLEFTLALQGTDLGFTAVTSITAVPAPTAGVLELHGGLLAQFSNTKLNQSSAFTFEDLDTLQNGSVSMIVTGIAAPASEAFESGWDNDLGFLDDLDALATEPADMDGLPGDGGIDQDAFESGWKLPIEPAVAPFNEVRKFQFEPWVDTDPLVEPIVVVAGANDVFGIFYTAGGTTVVLTPVVAAGSYTRAALATAIEAAIDAALTADAGTANAPHFTATVVNDFIRLTTSLSGSGMTLTAATGSIFATLGFGAAALNPRFPEADQLATGTYDTTPQAFEDFEEEWRDNETAIFSFVGPPTDLTAALFDAGVQDVEDFENLWTLML